MIEVRTLGRTGLKVSALGFGCGAVGGLVVRGDRQTVVGAVARAIELGITYFDTAAAYGNRRSEEQLGAALAELRRQGLAAPEAVHVGTKVMLTPADRGRVGAAVIASLEQSLRLLQLEAVDIFYLHNRLEVQPDPASSAMGPDEVEAAVEAFHSLKEAGKIRHWGLNGLGETGAIHDALSAWQPDAMQVCYNMLNPSAGVAVPSGFPFQDFRGLMDQAAAQQAGVVAIRVLAGGALSGTVERHPLAAPSLEPIATGADYAADVARAAQFAFLVEAGYAESLVEAAIRFVIANRAVSTALVGFSSLEQLEEAARYAARGPLPAQAEARIVAAAAH